MNPRRVTRHCDLTKTNHCCDETGNEWCCSPVSGSANNVMVDIVVGAGDRPSRIRSSKLGELWASSCLPPATQYTLSGMRYAGAAVDGSGRCDGGVIVRPPIRFVTEAGNRGADGGTKRLETGV
mmetsp:Transcript_52378/g.157184  ORF Transcript_52378/g.157184 Transcript_52378/m.157184 type:complete len:124 (-) Transcript_52378:831-1202(-)